MKLSAILLFLITPNFTFGQDQFELSDKHINRVNQESSSSKKLFLYRRYFKKDSIKHIKEINRYWRTQSDSITNALISREQALKKKNKAVSDGISSRTHRLVYKPWAQKQAARYLAQMEKSGFHPSVSFRVMLKNYLVDYFSQASQNDTLLFALRQHIPDLPLPKQLESKIGFYKTINAGELQAQAESKLNSASAGQLSSLQGKAKRYTGEINKYGKYGSILSGTDTLERFVKEEGETLAKKYISELGGSSQFNDIRDQLDEMDKFKGLTNEYKGQLDQLQDSAYIKQQAKKKVEELAMQYITDHPEVMQGVQRKMSLLMKKYSVVPNSNDLSTAVKRTSLKGKTFFERLQVALNFQVISLDPVSIDFAPQVGYKINSRWVAGAGGLYRKTFTDSIPSLAADVLGYKGYSTYEILGNFFVTGEYARNSPGAAISEGKSKRQWENTLLAGVGRKFLIHPKVEMTLMAGYNFLHANSDTIYTKPWVIRVGFQSSGLAFLNKKKLQAANLR